MMGSVAFAFDGARKWAALVATTALIAATLPLLAAQPAQAAALVETEPNSSRSTANVFGTGDAISGSTLLSGSTDYDYFAVDLPAAGRVSLDLRFPSNLGAGDVYDVDVYTASGSLLYHFDVTGNRHDGSWMRAFATYAPEGRLFVRVYGSKSWASWGKAYTLKAGFTAGNVETEFNASRSQPDVLTIGSATSGSALLSGSTDYDYFAVDLAAAKRMSLALSFPSNLGAGDVYDVDVYDPSGRLLYHFDITGNRASGSWLAAQSVSLPVGRSYVRIYGAKSWASWGKAYALNVRNVLTKTPTPQITGTPKVGQALKAVPGTWAPAPVTLKYQWLRSGQPIAGATAATYKLVKADLGKKITVRVAGSRSTFLSVGKTSAAKTVS